MMQSKRWFVIGVAGLCLGLAGCGQGTVAEPVKNAEVRQADLDVPYVPTPYVVVDEMLRLANLGKGDVLYDLGSGDGRIVITAAKRYGAHGIGIELDPRRIAESETNAQRAGVVGRVRFIQGDLFEADLSQASAVTLYLLSSVNERLRPKLLKELRPGTPVISHTFSMGEWEPDKIVKADGHDVFLWIIPAHAEGTWDLTADSAVATQRFVLSFSQTFQKVTGTAYIDGRQLPVEEGRIMGDQVVFSIPLPVRGVTTVRNFIGRIDGDAMQGVMDDSESGEETAWIARRLTSVVGRF